MSKNVFPLKGSVLNTGIEPVTSPDRSRDCSSIELIHQEKRTCLIVIVLHFCRSISGKKVEMNGVEPLTPCLQSPQIVQR
jgi:hypothetical protein